MILDVERLGDLEPGEIPGRHGHLAELDTRVRQDRRPVSDIGGIMSHAAIVCSRVQAAGGRRHGRRDEPDQDRRPRARGRRRRHGHDPLSDARYDAVVIGGGHHGTIIACYLARAGLSVSVLERSAHLGGGASTSEGPAPGFLMNHCSHWTRFYGHPAYRDFELHEKGLRYVFPDQNEGMIFDDGSSLIGFSASRVVDPVSGRQERCDQNIQRTWEQIARFSRRDAETYLKLLDAYERDWKPAFRRHRFSAPPPWGTPDALEDLLTTPGSMLEPVHQFMSLRQLARDFFESRELQTLFMRATTTSTGCFPDDVPGLQGLVHCLPLTLSFEPAAIAVGGSQAITDALAGRRAPARGRPPTQQRGRPHRRGGRAGQRGRACGRHAHRRGPGRQ